MFCKTFFARNSLVFQLQRVMLFKQMHQELGAKLSSSHFEQHTFFLKLENVILFHEIFR